MSNIILQATNICKNFYDPVKTEVLHNVSFAVQKGEFVSVVGKSGCGKSTLLYILSTMDTDYTGQLMIDGETMTGKPEKELAHVRNEKIGFVFQFHYLLNEFSVLKNVMLPALRLDRYPEAVIAEKALKKLDLLGILHLADKKANLLSGGEKQRVSIARSLINDPCIIMGDEPTGNLDKKNSQIVFELFKEVCQELNQTLLIVTHDLEFAAKTHRIIEMEDGQILKT